MSRAPRSFFSFSTTAPGRPHVCRLRLALSQQGHGAHAAQAPGLLVSHLISQYSLFAYHAILHGEFDGVEIYGGRLSLPNVFSSRLFNRRHDKWGLQARTLFAVELVRRIRSFVGPAPIISYRLSLLDLHAGGSEWHDLLAFAQALHY